MAGRRKTRLTVTADFLVSCASVGDLRQVEQAIAFRLGEMGAVLRRDVLGVYIAMPGGLNIDRRPVSGGIEAVVDGEDDGDD